MQQLEYWPVSDLIEYARNPRKNDHAVDKVAAAIREFGFRVPVLAKSDKTVVDGHLRLKAAKKLGLETVPVMLCDDMTDAQIKAFRLSVNRVAEEAEWDADLLRIELDELGEMGFDLELTGFSLDEIDELQIEEIEDGLTDEDAVPDLVDDPVSVMGDVWLLGKHRLMCGDSTSVDAVEKLMNGKKAPLLHADPPYGMGKEGDGVANDNLYSDKLDKFQMEWWATFRTFLEDNASAYIWGNAPDLWRLWYCGGLEKSERLTFRNLITWNKYVGNVKPTVIEMMRSYCKYREDCLFFIVGEQGFNNNSENYWEGWESIREYLESEMEKVGGRSKWKEALGNQMGSHYFTKSQWSLPTKEAYGKLKAFAKGQAFKKEYDQLKKEYDQLKQEFYETRAYFDNTHENMTDVWEFERVAGKERHDHATPKPVAMMERVMRSSLPKNGLCVEPFGGSGSTLMGAEKSGRVCYTMELQPVYIDTIIKRWQEYTGKAATLEATGETFEEVSHDRR